MAGHTISAYTDEHTAKRIQQMARQEDRTSAQIAAAALRLYVALPQEARQALRHLESLQDEAMLAQVTDNITRMLLNTQYEVARTQALATMQVSQLAVLETEDALLAEAVRTTT